MFVENGSTRWTMVIHLLAFIVVIGAEFIDDKGTGLIIASIAATLMVMSNIYLNKDLNRTGDRAKQHDQHIIDLKWLTNALGKLVTQKSNKLAASDPNDIDNMRTDSIKDLLSNIGGLFDHLAGYEANDSPFMVYFHEVTLIDEQTAFLSLQHWDNAKGANPCLDDPDNQARLFELTEQNNNGLPQVTCGLEKNIIVWEHPEQFSALAKQHLPDGVGSLICYPVYTEYTENNKKLLGVITVTSRLAGFFNHTNYDYHAEFLKQFAIRIVMEISALKRHQP